MPGKQDPAGTPRSTQGTPAGQGLCQRHDILARLDGHAIGLELKYPKRKLDCIADADGEAEEFHLPEGACDLDAAEFWHDTARLERLILEREIVAGTSVMVSNYALWVPGCLMGARSKAHAFALHDGRVVQAGDTLAWREATQSVDSGPVRLDHDYSCRWRPYSRIALPEVGFRYLVLEPGRAG